MDHSNAQISLHVIYLLRTMLILLYWFLFCFFLIVKWTVMNIENLTYIIIFSVCFMRMDFKNIWEFEMFLNCTNEEGTWQQ